MAGGPPDIPSSRGALGAVATLFGSGLALLATFTISLNNSFDELQKSMRGELAAMEIRLREEMIRLNDQAVRDDVVEQLERGLEQQINARFDDLVDRVQTVRSAQSSMQDWIALQNAQRQ